MNNRARLTPALACWLMLPCTALVGEVIFETTSPYHHIMVSDSYGVRTLLFDDSTQSQMSLDDPLKGHFEYTEYFHMPWLWNQQIENVLMIGLGGSSIQRSYNAYYPQVNTETVELDSKVLEVARDYFNFKEADNMKVIIGDGRMHLRRSQKKYDLIILDAYTANRYGFYIPYSLATREFFALAHEHLSDNGVLAYNVIGSIRGTRESIVGAVYKTLKTSFPHIYMFPAMGSRNVVLLATKSAVPATLSQLEYKADALIEAERIKLPTFKMRLRRFRQGPPASAARSSVLTDDFAPVDGLLRTE